MKTVSCYEAKALTSTGSPRLPSVYVIVTSNTAEISNEAGNECGIFITEKARKKNLVNYRAPCERMSELHCRREPGSNYLFTPCDFKKW